MRNIFEETLLRCFYNNKYKNTMKLYFHFFSDLNEWIPDES